jgi:hypothetical protein
VAWITTIRTHPENMTAMALLIVGVSQCQSIRHTDQVTFKHHHHIFEAAVVTAVGIIPPTALQQ